MPGKPTDGWIFRLKLVIYEHLGLLIFSIPTCPQLGVIIKQLLDFTQLIESDKNIDYKLKIYEEEGHVPYQSMYHGLKYLYKLHR